MLLDDIVTDSRWDMTYLGMQIMVEGLALAAFGFMHQMTTEPLLKKLLRYVMSDEARHVAFGVLSLQDYYAELSDAEIFERQQFAFEAAVRMRDRFLQQEVWERMEVPVKEAIELVMRTPTREMFQMMLFSKIVPNCKKLGLLDRNDAWLRRRFEEIGVIQFEDWVDTGDEYEQFAISEQRTAGLGLSGPHPGGGVRPRVGSSAPRRARALPVGSPRCATSPSCWCCTRCASPAWRGPEVLAGRLAVVGGGAASRSWLHHAEQGLVHPPPRQRCPAGR